MAPSPIEVRKLTPTLGAEVLGVDLSKELSPDDLERIRAALLENLVIFFREQELTPEQHKAFGRHFGKLHLHPAAPGLVEGHPEILVIKADEKSKHVAGEEWHSDVSCDAEPPMGSILYMTEVPSNGGGDTLFASMYAAYAGLSEPMRRFLEPLTAIHDGEHVYRGRYGVKDEGKVFPRAEHPIVRTHPVTGRKALYVNRGFTTRIPQLSHGESAAVLEMLYRHVETPEYQCRFKWRPGSIAFWDNRCVQHHAMWDYFPLRRYGHRVTICGDKPFLRA
jgi:taurine dioxygenase